MDAVILNESMTRILRYSNEQLLPLGFAPSAEPPREEDSGDLVSTESMSFVLSHQTLGLDLRFFVCCGKGAIEDYITVRLNDRYDQTLFIDASTVSEGCAEARLHLLDFNALKLPMALFLENFLDELTRLLPQLLEKAPLFLAEKRAQGPTPFSLI